MRTPNTLILVLLLLQCSFNLASQSTKLLRTPSLGDGHIAFAYASDIWVSDTDGKNVKRITSTQAGESYPHISPDGKSIAFTSNRSGVTAVYVVSIEGGTPAQLTYYPSGAKVCDWSPDGSHILFSSSRDAAPTSHSYLWKVSKDGGPVSKVTSQWGFDAKYNSDGTMVVVDKMRRWDSEWRMYRGGQNTPLILLNLSDNSETLIANDKTTDIRPVWLEQQIYFLSDRAGTTNIFQYDISTKSITQLTKLTGSDIKSLTGKGNTLLFEKDGLLHKYNIINKEIITLSINIIADFPWAEKKWDDVSDDITNVSLSTTGKRILLEARGEIFTVPAKDGAPRNLTLSSGAADRRPIWSPNGGKIAYFSDAGGEGYKLILEDQTGMEKPTKIDIGLSKLGWEPTWSPDGKHIAFVDDDTRVRILKLSDKTLKTIDNAGTNIERGNMGLTWSPDSKWLAYAKSGSNMLMKIMVWNASSGKVKQMTDPFADAVHPAWDRDGKHLYFAASTDVALASGWANTSSMQADPEYSIYVVNLLDEDKSPFAPKSDEEEVKDEKEEDKSQKNGKEKKGKKGDDEANEEPKLEVKIVFEGIERRVMPLKMDAGNYVQLIAGPEGSVFAAERKSGSRSLTVHKFVLEDGEAKEYASGISNLAVSADGMKMLGKAGGNWKIMDTSGASGGDGESVSIKLKMNLDRSAEWKQIFDEAWRYQRDYFYDPNMHGRDWDDVYLRYAPLLPFIKHRYDLTYVLDQMNGELSVGHSFVFGGDAPKTEKAAMGLLGADLLPENGRWRIKRIYTTENWNPGLSGPLDRPGTKIKNGYYIVGINGQEITEDENIFKFLDGTSGQQIILHINKVPTFSSSWQETVEPIRSENSLRQRTWVEDNRRMVDSLSGGQLAYIWVPNTSGAGVTSFDRYYFAQQDKAGAIIDERFNGGGYLDDYMVDLMTRKLRAALTNEVPNGAAMRLPAGIHGPKALLINEMAGSGGDFFPWVFKQQNAGPLIGATTWGGLVKSSTHYRFIDGGGMTAPDNAVFDPNNNEWIAENKGVAPDIPVRMNAKAMAENRDPQLERAVKEVLNLISTNPKQIVKYPPYPTPANGN